MQLFGKLAAYRRIFGAAGLLHAARAFLASAPFEVSLRRSGLQHPLYLRLKTSDPSTFWQVFVEREYDFALAAEPKVIVDAGANVGLASVWYANRYPRARIVALEPEASNFEVLRRNVAPYPTVVPLLAALWGRDEEVAVVDPGIGHWGFRTATAAGGGAASAIGPSAGKVRALTVDRLMAEQGLDRIDLLKVDIEGAEVEVFADASAWIDRVDAIAMELHDRMRPGCSRAVFAATAGFPHEAWRGENLFLSRAAPALAGARR